MKKLLAIITVLFVASAVASAQGGHFGVTAGLDFNSTKIEEIKSETKMGWRAGVTYMYDLALGFSIQPSLLYTQKTGESDLATIKQGSIVLPVSVQWGIDLLVAKPFLDVTPYVGYTVSSSLKETISDLTASLKGQRALDYGVGVGAGINIWNIQAVVRYNWDFGMMDSLNDALDSFVDSIKAKDSTYGGISVNLSYFF